MFKNYFKIAIRNIVRNKVFTIINITGLSVGLALVTLTLLWVQDELSYDRFHDNIDDIYRVISENIEEIRESKSVGSPAPVGPALVEGYPEITNFTRVQSGWSGWHFHYKEKTFMNERLACADASFFQIFKFPFIKGNPETALKDRHSMVLTEHLATKIFGEEDPMGKIVKHDDTDMIVTGVIKNIPSNSHIQFDYIFPIINMTDWRESQIDSWNYTQFATYVEVENGDCDLLNQKIRNLAAKYNPDSKIQMSLQPMGDIHLSSADINSWMIVYPNPGNLSHLYLFSLIALSILLLACINYMNLSTANSYNRSKEIGIRKVSGAFRVDLISQFLGETIFLAFFSFLLALILVELFLPSFNSLSGKTLNYHFFENGQISWFIFIIVLGTGFIAGSYPAFYMSNLKPVNTLYKQMISYSGQRGKSRKILVVIQFTFTIILIFCTLVLYQQINFFQSKDLGFNKDNVIYFASYGQYGRNFESAKNELLQNPDILGISRAFPPGRGYRGSSDVSWEGMDNSASVTFFSEFVDYDYLNVFKMEMSQGRFYSRERTTDPENYVLNQTAVRAMGITDPIGKKITHNGESGTIIGVIKDFHGGSLHHEIRPKVLKFDPEGFFVCVRHLPGKTRETIHFLEEKWKKFVPGYPFRYNLLNESIENFYNTEKQVFVIIQYFAILAIIIACLGLYGLVTFIAERKRKEVGIRKVLGAKTSTIVILFSREFSILVFIATLLAWPISWYYMSGWLENFAYKIDLNVWTFLLTGLIALSLALFTISFHALKAARRNPVEALKYE